MEPVCWFIILPSRHQKKSKTIPRLLHAATTGLKMMVYVSITGAYVSMFKETAIPIVITFLVLYLAFTVLEVLSAILLKKAAGTMLKTVFGQFLVLSLSKPLKIIVFRTFVKPIFQPENQAVQKPVVSVMLKMVELMALSSHFYFS